VTGQWETTNTYDPDDRITAEAGPSGSVSHSYDGDGNETTVNGQAASYDWENRLVGLGTAQNPTATASYLYDADGNRVAATTSGTTTDYLVDTTVGFPSVVEERSTSGSLLARYALGDDLIRMDRGSAASYYIFDGLGSTRALTNGSSVTDTYTYDAYGEQVSGTGSTTNAFRFDAQQLDGGTGDYFLRARYYSQSDGRFLSQDPVLGLDIAPISLHRYLYADNDPADETDPGGDFEEDLLISLPLEQEDIQEDATDEEVGATGASRLARLSAYFFALSVAVASIGEGLLGVDPTDPGNYQPGKITFQADSNIFQVGNAKQKVRNDRIDNEILHSPQYELLVCPTTEAEIIGNPKILPATLIEQRTRLAGYPGGATIVHVPDGDISNISGTAIYGKGNFGLADATLLATANDQGVGVLTTNDKIRAQAMDGQKVRLNDGSMQSRNDLFGQIPIYSVSQGPPPMLLP
jgi:RHS repeat-associated protein